ncbi:hypothetical protein Ahy_B03g061944 isoform D [Arachis hypogaea]|uniref:Uncharacterized protein n=1 Tax=Arachis hypogaea TaxID=3818 RepID=A0A444ZSJ8_ARAHY|nr:hypothetical protein Ahy_B03g061944 isoform D [Arachis hypogaea]
MQAEEDTMQPCPYVIGVVKGEKQASHPHHGNHHETRSPGEGDLNRNKTADYVHGQKPFDQKRKTQVVIVKENKLTPAIGIIDIGRPSWKRKSPPLKSLP